LLERLDKLSAAIDYRHALDGLVMFVNADFDAKFYLPFTVPERVVIAERFLTRDLVFAMNRTPRYWVLALSEQPTRLFEGTLDTLVEIQDRRLPDDARRAGRRHRAAGRLRRQPLRAS
jgi:hypothetical protein